jgi:hypothetical protein
MKADASSRSDGSSSPGTFSHPDLSALSDSALSEKDQRYHSTENDADFGNSRNFDGTADIIDLVSFHEINNIQSALNCVSNAVCSQLSWSESRGQATATILLLLHQLGAVTKLIADIIQESTNERCHVLHTSNSGLTRPAAVISFNTAIEAACGDLTFLVRTPKPQSLPDFPTPSHSPSTSNCTLVSFK